MKEFLEFNKIEIMKNFNNDVHKLLLTFYVWKLEINGEMLKKKIKKIKKGICGIRTHDHIFLIELMRDKLTP